MLEWQELLDGENATLILNGKLTFESTANLRNRTKELVLQHPITRLTFDMNNVRFVDSSGLGLLVSVKNTMTKRNGSFIMRNVCDTVRNIMKQTGLDRYFEL